MRILIRAALPVGVLLLSSSHGLAQERPCVEERDQLRVLGRLLGDARGQAELNLAEALRRLNHAEAEVARLKAQLAEMGKQRPKATQP